MDYLRTLLRAHHFQRASVYRLHVLEKCARTLNHELCRKLGTNTLNKILSEEFSNQYLEGMD